MNKLVTLTYKTILRRLNNGAHADFFERLIALLIPLMNNFPALLSVFNKLNSEYQREDTLFKQSTASALTGEIRTQHDKRLAYFSFFWSSVEIVRFAVDQAKLQAMQKLLFLKKVYIKLPTQDYTNVSGLMTNFLQDCNNTVYKPSVEALDLMSLVTEMFSANESFKTLYSERSVDKVDVSHLGTLSAARLDVDQALNNFVDAINALWIANEIGAKDADLSSKLVAVSDVLTALVRQAQLNLAHRGVHHTTGETDENNGNEDAGTETPDPEDPPTEPPTDTQDPNITLPGPGPVDPNEHPPAGERKVPKKKKRKK
ncbi:MAG: DUF6261 family protein [Tannerellaceae bacterium]|jgi:hypothetical protein|nr:DUF6261 family protein [Tannerellaceae bacterium]